MHQGFTRPTKPAATSSRRVPLASPVPVQQQEVPTAQQHRPTIKSYHKSATSRHPGKQPPQSRVQPTSSVPPPTHPTAPSHHNVAHCGPSSTTRVRLSRYQPQTPPCDVSGGQSSPTKLVILTGLGVWRGTHDEDCCDEDQWALEEAQRRIGTIGLIIEQIRFAINFTRVEFGSTGVLCFSEAALGLTVRIPKR